MIKREEWTYPSNCVEVLVNVLRDRVNLGMKLIFNLEEVMFIILCHKVDSQTKVAESSRPTNPVKISLWKFRKIKVNDHVHWHYVNTTGKQVGAHKTSSFSILKIVINLISIALLHFWMNVETWVSKLRNLLRKKFHSFGRIAKDNRLINVKFGE